MSSGDVEGNIESRNGDSNRVLGTCPCFSIMDGRPVCLNGLTIEDVEAIGICPDIIESTIGLVSQHVEGELPICHRAVQISDPEDGVICVSRQIPVRIRDHTLTKNELVDALELFPKGNFSTEQDICTECLYKLIAVNLEQ